MCLSFETLTSIIRTCLPILVELIDLVNSVIIFLSQMTLLRWSTFLLVSQAVALNVLLFCIYLFLLMLVFVLPWLSLHWEILIMLLSQYLLTFHYIQNRIPHFVTSLMTIHSRADWDCLCNHLRDVPWEDIFKLVASVAASEFCELVQVGIDAYVPHRKYQVKPHLFPWFSAAFVSKG